MSGPRRAVALLLVGLVAVLGACSLVTSTIDTTRALQADDFANVRVLPSAVNGGTVVHVTADPPPGATDPVRTAGRDVWEHFGFRFALVQVSLRGRPTTAMSHDELAAAFGPRPAGFDDRAINDSVRRVAVTTVAVGSGVLLVVGILISVLVVRRRRRTAVAVPAQGNALSPVNAPPWMASWWQPGGHPPPGPPPTAGPPPGFLPTAGPPPAGPPAGAPPAGPPLAGPPVSDPARGYGYRDGPAAPPS